MEPLIERFMRIAIVCFICFWISLVSFKIYEAYKCNEFGIKIISAEKRNNYYIVELQDYYRNHTYRKRISNKNEYWYSVETAKAFIKPNHQPFLTRAEWMIEDGDSVEKLESNYENR